AANWPTSARSDISIPRPAMATGQLAPASLPNSLPKGLIARRKSRMSIGAPCWCPDFFCQLSIEEMVMNKPVNGSHSDGGDGFLFGRGAAWFAYGMTMALLIFDYVDRQVIVSMFPYLKAEWNLSDKELGLL